MKSIRDDHRFLAGLAIVVGLAAASATALAGPMAHPRHQRASLADPGTAPSASDAWVFSGCAGMSFDSTCASPEGMTARGVANTGIGSTIAGAGVALYAGGIGVSAADEARGIARSGIDNAGSIDGIYLSFGAEAALDAITVGWLRGDADISLYRYSGEGDPWEDGALLGQTYAGLLANGWSLVGNYSDLRANTARQVNPASLTSTYWLITACNASRGTGASCDKKKDIFRLKSLQVTETTPPGSPGASNPPSGSNGQSQGNTPGLTDESPSTDPPSSDGPTNDPPSDVPPMGDTVPPGLQLTYDENPWNEPSLCGGTTGIACAATVPEPGILGLLGSALAGALLISRRRSRPR